MSDATALPPSVVSSLAKNFVGPLLLGAIINVWLVRMAYIIPRRALSLTLDRPKYGAFLMQVQTYFRHARK
jgi:hypothetical protein